MTEKIFTEEQYKAITDCFDKLRQDYTYGLLNSFLVDKLQQELSGTVNTNIYWPEIVSIANPRTRQRAHDQYVEKEKKYYWKSKKQFGGRLKVLVKSADEYPADSFYLSPINRDAFTETEVREACYNPDMFDREEVE